MVKLNLCQNQQNKKQDIIPCISVLLSQSLKQLKLCVNEYMCTVEKIANIHYVSSFKLWIVIFFSMKMWVCFSGRKIKYLKECIL